MDRLLKTNEHNNIQQDYLNGIVSNFNQGKVVTNFDSFSFIRFQNQVSFYFQGDLRARHL